MAPQRRTPDGADPAAYRWMERLDRPGWAWEWLRRDPTYRGGVSARATRHAVDLLVMGGGDPQRGLL